MKKTLIVLAVATLASVSANADIIIFDNTTANTGTIGGTQIASDNSYEISSLFSLTSPMTISGVNFWTNGGDDVQTINWAISCCAYGNGFNYIFESGTATTTDVNLGGGIDEDSFNITTPLILPQGGYFLELWGATGVSNGNVYWDESNGANSIAFTGTSSTSPSQLSDSLSFQIVGSPEPSTSWLLAGTGIMLGISRMIAVVNKRRIRRLAELAS